MIEIPVGSQFKTELGRWVRTTEPSFKPGGQAVGAPAVYGDSEEKVFVKIYLQALQNQVMVERSRFQASLNLLSECPTLCGPIDVINSSQTGCGVVAPFVEGKPLFKTLGESAPCITDMLTIAIAFCHSLDFLHTTFQIAHGDVHNENVKAIKQPNGSYLIWLIDFCNFWHMSFDKPPSLGHPEYFAPEVSTQKSLPNIETDLFSLTVLMSEILLGHHVAEQYRADPTNFAAVMRSGKWPDDPLTRKTPESLLNGYSSSLLNSEIQQLFRDGLSLDPMKRPSARRWKDALLEVAVGGIHVCSKCNMPDFCDKGRYNCPHCNTPYPILSLVGTFGKIELESTFTQITKPMLGGSQYVSSLHAVVRRDGPDFRLEDRSSNGIFRLLPNGDWFRFKEQNGIWPTIQEGDLIRFADVFCMVKRAGYVDNGQSRNPFATINLSV